MLRGTEGVPPVLKKDVLEEAQFECCLEGTQEYNICKVRGEKRLRLDENGWFRKLLLI